MGAKGLVALLLCALTLPFAAADISTQSISLTGAPLPDSSEDAPRSVEILKKYLPEGGKSSL